MQEGTRKVLVGVDFSASSELAVAWAAQFAQALHLRLELVYIHQLTAVAVPEVMIPPVDETAVLNEAEKRLREVAVRAAPHATTGIHLRVGAPVAGMLQLIDELAPVFVVVGSHGRGAVMRLLLGSVAEQLCRTSPVPVFVVPAPERAIAAKEAPTTTSAVTDQTVTPPLPTVPAQPRAASRHN